MCNRTLYGHDNIIEWQKCCAVWMSVYADGWREPEPAPLLMNWSQISLAARPRFSLWHGSKREVGSGGQTMGQPQCSDQRQMLQGFNLRQHVAPALLLKCLPGTGEGYLVSRYLFSLGKPSAQWAITLDTQNKKHAHNIAACMRIKCGKCR